MLRYPVPMFLAMLLLFSPDFSRLCLTKTVGLNRILYVCVQNHIRQFYDNRGGQILCQSTGKPVQIRYSRPCCVADEGTDKLIGKIPEKRFRRKMLSQKTSRLCRLFMRFRANRKSGAMRGFCPFLSCSFLRQMAEFFVFTAIFVRTVCENKANVYPVCSELAEKKRRIL